MPLSIPILGSVREPFGLILIVLATLVFLSFYFLVRQGLKPDLRPLGGYDALLDQVGQAVESGGRVHVSLGPNGLVGEETTTTLAGVAVLDLVSAASAISDRAPVASTSDATALPIMSDTIRRAYQDRGTLEKYESTAARLVAFDPVAMAGGVTSIVGSEQVRANVLVGSFGPETALMAEAGNRKGISQVVGSDRLEAQAASYVMADHTLIGEEIYVARAYLQNHAPTVAGVLAQDIMRWVVIGAIVVGLILYAANVIPR